MPFVTVRDLQIYFELRGKGPRLLGIGGTGGDLRRSPTVFEMLPAQGFEILAYDQRGLGQTSRPDRPYTMADYADDANALIEALGWERCLVAGFSFGGMVAQELALRYPHRVERLVLASTSSGGAGGSSYPLHEIAGLPSEDYICRLISLSDTRRDAAWQAAHPEQFQALFEQILSGLQIGDDEPGRGIGAHRQLEARAHHDTYERLPTLQMPVYICGGRYDGIATPAGMEAMRRQIPGRGWSSLKGAIFFSSRTRGRSRASRPFCGERSAIKPC